MVDDIRRVYEGECTRLPDVTIPKSSMLGFKDTQALGSDVTPAWRRDTSRSVFVTPRL